MSRLFGTSGIRRRVDELPDQFAVNLGRALGSVVDCKVAVGRDTRPSGPRLESALIAGLLSTGTDVLEVGVAPTPTVCVAASEHGAGAVVTASHNPPEYNGFKLFNREGAFKPKEEDMVEGVVKSLKFIEGAGGSKKQDYTGKHVKLIEGVVGGAEGVKVLVDCAGGAGSTVTPKLLESMRCKAKFIHDNRDGVFPHGLEPTAENLKRTCEAVRKSGVDVAFAHDGDADRTCAIGGDGELIEWDTFLTVLASQSRKVVTTVDASMRIEEYCKKVIRVAVGDVAVAEGIRNHKAGFGGEPSGTYIFPDVHMYPDGIATVGKALKLVADGRFYELVEDIPSYPMERVKIACDHNNKEKIMNNLKKSLNNLNYSDVDGVRVEEDDGWVLIRPSGTEDYIRITAEAKTQDKLDKLVKEGKQWIKQAT
ncbi:MAG: phosphoglucosamine mutase [Candidatus Altiarchaeales archaeon]|nr:phosphoglucosamine mutase [Candidatus Altiarchaeales archaeon]MBD3415664.1 phosphoglucosamine mutase [Candidatus Altiarchaeales archaeon]